MAWSVSIYCRSGRTEPMPDGWGPSHLSVSPTVSYKVKLPITSISLLRQIRNLSVCYVKNSSGESDFQRKSFWRLIKFLYHSSIWLAYSWNHLIRLPKLNDIGSGREQSLYPSPLPWRQMPADAFLMPFCNSLFLNTDCCKERKHRASAVIHSHIRSGDVWPLGSWIC